MKRNGIDGYEILGPLATGGMAEVFLARSKVTHGRGKLVALKRTLPDYLDSDELREMFLNEIRIAACLNHQNIVQTIDFGFHNSQGYLVMELIHGITLRQLIGKLRNTGRFLPLEMILYIAREVTDALVYAANASDLSNGNPLNLVHRDISPHNIMLTYDGEVKVIDFGIAKVAEQAQNTQLGVVKGKIAYMSPEQARGHVIDTRSDLFSLGIVIWELLSNRRLFAGPDVAEVKRRVRDFRFESINIQESSTIRGMSNVLIRLLHQDREQRFASAAELGRELNFHLNRIAPEFSPLELSKLLKEFFVEEYLSSLDRLRRLHEDEGVNTDLVQTDFIKTDLVKTDLVKTERLSAVPPVMPVAPPINIPRVVSAPARRVIRVNSIRVISENHGLELDYRFWLIVVAAAACLIYSFMKLS